MSKILFQIENIKKRIGGQSPSWLPANAASPPVEYATFKLEIVEEEDGIFLYSESDNPKFPGGDTWHETINDAMAHAEFEFGVKPDQWQLVNDS